MRIVMLAVGLVSFLSVALVGQAPAPAQGGGARGAGPQIVWSPKAVKPGDWVAPHKPHTKLAELLAKHKGRAEWTETIVDDDTLHAEYISMAPGGNRSSPRRASSCKCRIGRCTRSRPWATGRRCASR